MAFIASVSSRPQRHTGIFRCCTTVVRIGIGFKKTDPEGGVHLFWIKRRDLTRFGHHWQEKVIKALQAAAIPQERYGDYPFLRA